MSFLISLADSVLTLSYRYLGGTLMQAGADTTARVLQFFIACMAAYPDIQTRGQKEVDDVIGPHRTPEQEDINRLPYVKAIINEVRMDA